MAGVLALKHGPTSEVMHHREPLATYKLFDKKSKVGITLKSTGKIFKQIPGKKNIDGFYALT